MAHCFGVLGCPRACGVPPCMLGAPVHVGCPRACWVPPCMWGAPVHVGCPRACGVPPCMLGAPVHVARQFTTRVSPPQASAHHTRQHTTRVSPPIDSAHQSRQSTTRVSPPHPSALHPRQSTLESSVTVRPASELWRAAAPAGGSAVRCSGFPCAARAERAAQVHVIPPPARRDPGETRARPPVRISI
jgi:hypothetical protein